MSPESKRANRPRIRLALGAIFGLGLGLAAGLLIAYQLAPVEWTDGGPQDLRKDYAAFYVELVAESYAKHGDLEAITLRDGHRGYQVKINFGQQAEVWRFPIETVSQSEEGFERVYQSTVVMPVWKIKLEPGDSWDNTLEILIEEVPKYEDEETEEVEAEELAEVEF